MALIPRGSIRGLLDRKARLDLSVKCTHYSRHGAALLVSRMRPSKQKDIDSDYWAWRLYDQICSSSLKKQAVNL
jgi:hypothetical protein